MSEQTQGHENSNPSEEAMAQAVREKDIEKVELCLATLPDDDAREDRLHWLISEHDMNFINDPSAYEQLGDPGYGVAGERRERELQEIHKDKNSFVYKLSELKKKYAS